MKPLARFVATLGPVGFLPIAPATWGSGVVALAGWFIPVPPLPALAVLFALTVALAVWAAGEAEKTYGHDAKPIIVDELVGQWLALLFVPHRLFAFATAFVLFRVFDVWKPLGAREVQRLPGGYGVVADDMIAGITACLAFHALGWIAGKTGCPAF